MTWDLKRRESLTDYNLERFQIKMVSNLTSGDQIGWFSNFFFFFSFLPPSFFFRDFEYQFVWVWWVRMALDSIGLLECPICTNSMVVNGELGACLGARVRRGATKAPLRL